MSGNLRRQFDQYIGKLFTQQDDVLDWILAESHRNDMPLISIRTYEGYLLGWLVRLIGAKKVVEVGTLAGYSAIWIARSLPEDGKLYTVEVNPKHAEVARAGFERAGLQDRIEILQGNAHAMLEQLEQQSPFDFVFIDAEKDGYLLYREWAVDNLRKGGIVAAHNAFRGGAVLDPRTEADKLVDGFNRSLAEHPRLDPMIIPLGDAFALGVKR